jgi:hypothetical protein
LPGCIAHEPTDRLFVEQAFSSHTISGATASVEVWTGGSTNKVSQL